MEILWIVVVLLVILWLLGFMVVPMGGSLIHLLLVIALVLVIVRLARGQRIF